MKNIFQLGIIAVLALFFTACKTTTPSFYNYETECIGVEMDGSQTLKSYGKGRYRLDAVRMAKKQALRDVLFKGHFKGNGGCMEKPLILEVNAEEKYESYFNNFFRDGGEYDNFITMQDEKIGKSIFRTRESGNKDQSTYGVVVRVLRTELKDKLIKDGILKQ